SPGQDAPSPPRPPHLPSNLLGHLGIRRAGLPRAARRRYRRSRVRLARLPGRFDESSQDLGGTPAVQRLATDLHGLGPILRSTGSQDRRGRIEENDIERGPMSPFSTWRSSAAFSGGVPPFKSSGRARARPRSFGSRSKSSTLPS